MPIDIRPFEPDDWPALWPLLHAVFAQGDTYTFPSDATENAIHAAWIQAPTATFVATNATGTILGSYYIKPNQTGNGAHVCNCGYVVAESARGRGIASAMCAHSQTTALELGFLAMQFNFVIATNTGAIRLWQKLGFDIVGTIPQAFRHPQQGRVAAHIMYKWLADA